jgi:hypothetical protein
VQTSARRNRTIWRSGPASDANALSRSDESWPRFIPWELTDRLVPMGQINLADMGTQQGAVRDTTLPFVTAAPIDKIKPCASVWVHLTLHPCRTCQLEHR